MTDEKIPEDGAEEAGQENIEAPADAGDASESGASDENAESSASSEGAESSASDEGAESSASSEGAESGDAAADEVSADDAKPEPEDLTVSPGDDDKIVNEGDASEDDAEAAMLALLEELPQEESGAKPEDINFGSAEVSGAEFQQLSEPSGKDEPRNIDILKDVNLPIAIELGRTKMTIAEILSLGPGSVVELNKLAGEPVDVLVNNKAVAKGEVVVIDENFGVRITQLLTPEERLKALGKE